MYANVVPEGLKQWTCTWHIQWAGRCEFDPCCHPPGQHCSYAQEEVPYFTLDMLSVQY